MNEFYVYWMAKDESGKLHFNRSLVEAEDRAIAKFKVEQVVREIPGFLKIMGAV